MSPIYLSRIKEGKKKGKRESKRERRKERVGRHQNKKMKWVSGCLACG